MTVNPLETWIKKNKKLSQLLVDIEASSSSIEAAALAAFHQVAELFNLPKMPTDITDAHHKSHKKLGIEPQSVFQQLAILKFIEPEGDLRGLVMMALYSVHFKSYIDIAEAAIKYYGGTDKLPAVYSAYYFGKDIDDSLAFSINGDNWVEAGAVLREQVSAAY